MFHSRKIWLQYVTQAYITGHVLQRDVFVELAKEFNLPVDTYLKLLKTFYDLSESGDSWFHKRNNFLKDNSAYVRLLEIFLSIINMIKLTKCFNVLWTYMLKILWLLGTQKSKSSRSKPPKRLHLEKTSFFFVRSHINKTLKGYF